MKYCGHHKLDPDSLWCWCWLGGWWPIPYVAKSIAEYTNMTYFSVILCRSWLDSTKMSLVDTCQNRFHNVWSNCSNKFYYVSHSEHQRIRGMGGLFTNSKCISEVIWRMEESGGFWWLHCRPITCFPPHTRWPDLRCGTFVRPSDLSVHLCLTCLSTFVCSSPLSHLSEHLCQMTEGLLRWPDSHLLSNHLAPLSPVVNPGRACQCVAHAPILPGPQGSLDHTWPPPAPCSSVLCVWQAARGTSEGPPCPQVPICWCHQCALLARLLLSPKIWWENWTAMARYWARWLD